MANWKALTWSESITTGKQAARHVLTVLCLKCDDEYRVFSDAARLAGFCEISTRRLYGWRDYLEEHGFVTVIRRVRGNGSEAKPITLLNVPDASHLNGVPVVLDYHGKYLYPRNPEELRAANVQWISAGQPGQTHPAHLDAQKEDSQGDISSGWQPDELAGCMSRGEAKPPQAEQGDDSSGCQPDESSPHGADDSSPPKHFPLKIFPSNQPGASEPQRSTLDTLGANWVVGGNNQTLQHATATLELGTHGSRMLRSLGITGRALATWTPTVDTGLEQLGHRQVREILLGGREQPGTGAIIKTRLPQLHSRLSAGDLSGKSFPGGSSRTTAATPHLWCGDCDPSSVQYNGRIKPICSTTCSTAM